MEQFRHPRLQLGWIAAALLLPCTLLAELAQARGTLRCNGRLASVGDFDLQLRDICGEPFFIDAWMEVVSVLAAPDVAIATPMRFEDWYFDHGPNRLLQRVRLREGQIVAVDSLSAYGRRRPLEACRGASVRTGISVGELVDLCGEPARRRELGQALVIGQSPAESVIPTRHERWWYPLPGARWLLVELQGGRVRGLDSDITR